MPETLTAADFEQRVQQVSERLDELRGATRSMAASAGPYVYAGLDLTDELPQMAPILGALLNQEPDEPLTTNVRLEVGARRLALAALVTLLKAGEGLVDFPARYQTLMGVEPDYAALERLLPNAMREAGLALPVRHDARRLLEAVQLVAGLPTSLVQAMAEYFVIYWRLFHPQANPLAPLEALAEAPKEWGVDAETRKTLEVLSKKLLPTAGVAAATLDGLTKVMQFLRTQPKWRVADLFTQAEAIADGCGVNPKELLHGSEEALATLSRDLGHAWHPEQFRHVLMATPRGTEVRQPNGSLALVERAVSIPFWGLYRIEGKTYMVLPNEALTIAAVRAMPEQGLWYEGNRAVWRGPAPAEVFADNWPQIETPRHLYEDKQPVGWFYFHVPPMGRTLRIDALELAPRPGVSMATSLLATVDEAGKPHLKIRAAGLRVTLPELAGHTLQLECAQAETAGRLTFELDERGVGGLPEVLLNLAEPKAGVVELFLQDHATGEVIQQNGRPLTYRVSLPEVMLFAEATGQLVTPSQLTYPYGLPAYLIFATRPLNTSALQMQEIGIDKLDKSGDFEVNRLKWADPHQALSIFIDNQFVWNFDIRVETVWQAGELPPATAPFAYEAVTPVGYTVSTPDYLAIDDISFVESPMVVISREGNVLASHTWDELNWMTNFPVENRRFSGLMLRRALHVAQEFDLGGRYSISMKVGGKVLGERQITILPQLDIRVTPVGPQLEDAEFSLTARSQHPCFAGGLTSASMKLGHAVVDRDVMENSPFQPKPPGGTLCLQVPLMDLPMKVAADVIGFRLFEENEGSWIRKTNLSYDELSTITLVLFGANAREGSLKVGDAEALTEEFYEGFATFSLASMKESLRQHQTEVEVSIDGRVVGTLIVAWHPKIHAFEAANAYLSMDHKAMLELQVEGPEDVAIRLEALSPDGRKLGTTEVKVGANEPQTVMFDVPASRDYSVITIKAYDPTEVTGVASGSVEVRNAAFEPEIEEINKRIAAEPQSAQLRHQRAQLLLDRGLRKAASKDFQAAVDLGMTELLDSPQYQQFMSQRQAESFHEDLKAIASFFVPFARKELNIG